MADQDTKLLLVIPCLNEEAGLEKLVRQLVRDNTGLSTQIIIVDGQSTDSTRSIAERLTHEYDNLHLLDNPKRLQSAALNLAVETYGNDAEMLIRIDAHADYPPSYCHMLLRDAKETGADAVVVSMNTVGKTPFQDAVAVAQNSKLGNGGSAHRNTTQQGKWVDHGHHALMRLKAYQAVGGYDESFSHNEDAELDIRLRKAGYRIWLTGKTSLTYYPRADAISLFRQYFHYGHGRARNILKHKTLPRLRQLAPAAITPILLLTLFKPVLPIVILPALAWALPCTSYGVMLAIRQEKPHLALVGPAAMIMHMGWSFGFWFALIQHWSKRS